MRPYFGLKPEREVGHDLINVEARAYPHSPNPSCAIRHQSHHLINTFPSHREPLDFDFPSSKSRCPLLPDYLTELSFSSICYEPRRVHTTTSISTLLAALPFGHRQPQAPPVAQVKTPSHRGPGGTWNNDTTRAHQGHIYNSFSCG